MILVWYAQWEHDCCGDEFSIGDRVDWALSRHEVDVEYLTALLGADLTAQVGAVRMEHEEPPLPRVQGVVTRIRRVSCRERLLEDGVSLVRVGGTTVLRDVATAPRFPDDRHDPGGPLHARGHLVALDLA
ncbi:DUF6578 domain-containing protein [Isoptericola aurantiacus]|uniref:DUF6578 domain-containing protein n=1 Tax=Isoptericola aurantiacus TaxID=3377839 RepID=UPI00383ADA50